MALRLLELYEDQNAHVMMQHDAYGSFFGLRQEDFRVAGAAEYNNPYQTHMQDNNTRLQAISSAISGLTGYGLDIPNLQTQVQSLHQYVGSERPQFQVQMTLIRIDPNDPPVTKYSSLLISATFPFKGKGSFATDAGGVKGAINSAESNLLISPGGYRPNKAIDKADDFQKADAAVSPGNCWTLKVGQYFLAHNLVLRSAEAQYSAAIVEDNTPLFAVMTLSFEPVVIPTEDEVRGWFITGGYQAPAAGFAI